MIELAPWNKLSTDALMKAFWANNPGGIVLLCHFDETNAAWTDSSGNPLTINNSGNQYNASGKFGGCLSAPNDGSYSDVAISSLLNFGTNDFTICCWIYPASQPHAYPDFISNNSPTFGSTLSFSMRFRPDNHVTIHSGCLGDPYMASAKSYDPSFWHFVALCRYGLTMYLLVDNDVAATALINANQIINWGGTYNLRIGRNGWDGTNGYYKGLIDEVLVVKGTALWTSAIANLPTAPWNNPTGIGIYSESAIVADYTYALKFVASQTSSLGQQLIALLSSTWNLTGQQTIKIKIAAGRIGSNLKFSLINGGSGGDSSTTNFTPVISAAGTNYIEYTLDISSVADSAKNAINQLIITILNADADNTVYIDKWATLSAGEGIGTSTGGGGRIMRSSIIGARL
ncbi:MAG: LamG domain-containing protein [Smithella sp.]|jgi:hypothetical protein